MKITSRGITAVIFWIGFGSFLATSIPHVAWLYRVYEPANDWYPYITSYGVAIGIDVMIAWLSFICAKGKVLEWWITVLFILALSALSQYANFLYAMSNDPIHQPDIWNIGLFGGITTTGYLTPMIISAIPFFSLAYTFMLSRLDRSEIDLKALEAQLENRKAAKAIRERYQDTDKESFEKKAKGALTSVIGVVKHAVNEVSGSQSIAGQVDTQTVIEEVINEVSEGIPEEHSNVVQIGSTSLRYVPLAKAAEMLQYDLSTVKRMVTQGKLKTAPKTDQIVTMASINRLLQGRQGFAKKAVSEINARVDQNTEEIAIGEVETDKVPVLAY
jgi:hypothetical protein